LLNSKWISTAAQLGFDVLSYKTIRSQEHPGHPLPNMLYVDCPTVTLEADSLPIFALEQPPENVNSIAVTNSFGMPSRSRKYLEEDIPRANASLQEGQVMIVSVVGTPSVSKCSSVHDKSDYSRFVEDFVETATFAKSCGAKIIEANFSCPNVATGEGSIYQNAESVRDIASHIVKAIGDTPLIIKVGTYTEETAMRDTFKAAAKAKVAAICGINSVSKKVLSPVSNEPALGASRAISGVCGGPIRQTALRFVSKAKEIIRKEQLPLDLLGCGGITQPQHFTEFLAEGCSVAMTATGMMWDPLLAARYHSLQQQAC